jgi:hypothetical protein
MPGVRQEALAIAPCAASTCQGLQGPPSRLGRGDLRDHSSTCTSQSLPQAFIEVKIEAFLAPAIGLEPMTYRLTEGLS